MSKQSEIDRRWLEYQNTHPNFALEARMRKISAPQAEQQILGGKRQRPTLLPISVIMAYAVTISTLIFLGSLFTIRYIANDRKPDTQDWDEWASQAESSGGQRRDH